MSDLPDARWWTVRRAQSFKARSYTCPLCLKQLHAMTDHVLIAPEGDIEQRRHAHPLCVREARSRGSLLMRDEWEALQGHAHDRGGLLGKLLGKRAETREPASG